MTHFVNPAAHASSGDDALDHAVWLGAHGYRLHPVRITLVRNDNGELKKKFTGLPSGWQRGGETERGNIELVWRSVGATGYLIACGPSGVTVIDLDHHPEQTPPIDGRAAWAAAGGPRSGFVVATQSGGEHHYFAAGGAGSDSVGLAGVDVRGVGGGVVGPGSVVVDAAGVVVGKYTITAGTPDRAALPQEPPLPDHVRPRASAEPGSIWNPPKTTSTAARQWEGLHRRFVDGLRYHAATGWGAEGHSFLLRVTRELAGLAPEHARRAFDEWFAEAGVAPDARDLAKLESAMSFPPDVIVADHVVVGSSSSEQSLEGSARVVAPPVGNLPEEFWASRPVLGHIRAAAHSRACSADAVLGVLLARLASCVPGGLRVDTGVRVPTPLSTYSVLLGDSGTGKSSAAAVALSLMPAGVYLTETHPMGSGEGLCDAYMSAAKASEIPGADPDAKGTVYVQTEWNAFFHADEGARVLEVGKRSGSSLLPTLRDAWSGGEFGQRNTTAGGKSRKVSGATIGAWIGLQQPHAVELLTGANAVDGTLQRFLWWASSDPSIPDYAGPWPGPIPMAPHALNTTALTAIGVHPDITTELRARQVARARGTLVPAAGREQDDALRVRLGALLALLDGRNVIDLGDWALALVVLDTSAGHVARVRAAERDAQRELEAGRIGSRLRQYDAEQDHVAQRYDTEVERIVSKIVARMAGVVDGLPRTKLRESVARRRHEEFETALVLAEDRGLVRVTHAEAHGDRVYPL
jgi:hypothetical protein